MSKRKSSQKPKSKNTGKFKNLAEVVKFLFDKRKVDRADLKEDTEIARRDLSSKIVNTQMKMK